MRKYPHRTSPRQPLISRATKAALMAEKGGIGNAEPRIRGLAADAGALGLAAVPPRKKPAKRLGGLSKRALRPTSTRCQHHHDLAAFEPGVLLDLGVFGHVGLHLVQQLGADLLVRHFATAIAQR